MIQEKNENALKGEMTIEETAVQFSRLEPDFVAAKTLRDRMRNRLIDYVKQQQNAFAGNEKSYHIKGGVVVRRASKIVPHFDERKMNSAWLKSMLATPSAVAIKVVIDPKKLVYDDDTKLLLDIIGYSEETQHSYKVETTTVQNQ